MMIAMMMTALIQTVIISHTHYNYFIYIIDSMTVHHSIVYTVDYFKFERYYY